MYHGSRRTWKFRKEKKELGGKFGGHVVIQIDDHVYGFIYRDKKRIHIFPRPNRKNCTFQKQSVTEWETSVQLKKQTNVHIPVSESEKTAVLNYFDENLKEPSVDYSFFGERCASNCYHILQNIHKIKGGNYLFYAFYPGQFMKTLLNEAERSNYEIERIEGSKTRIWN